MFKGYQDTSNQSQFKGFPNLNMQGAVSAYGFSGVSFWLDAAYGLNTQTNLGAVSSWQQRVGGGTFVQATAGSQPRLILSDANYNGYSSVESVDDNRLMNSPAGQGLKRNPLFTIAMISKVNTTNVANNIITNGININSIIRDGGTSAGVNGFGVIDQSSVFFQGTTESTNARIKIATSTNIIVNGAIEATGTSTFAASELTRIFTYQGGSGTLQGTIAEIIAFPYSMTSIDAIALSDRINQKYALY